MKRFACLMLVSAVCTACAPGLAGEGAYASQVAATIFAEETAARSPGTPSTALRSAQPVASWTPSEQGSVSASSPAPTHAPSLEGTPAPVASDAIAAANASSVSELARWGSGVIYDSVVSPDGTWFAHATSLGATVYDAADGTQRYQFPSVAACQSLAACPGAGCLVFACDNNRLYVVSPIDGSEIATVRTSAGEGIVLELRFSDDGRRLLAWARDTYGLYVESAGVEVWSAETWEELAGIPLSGSRIQDVQTDLHGAVAALSVDQGQVLVYDLVTGERLAVFSSSSGGPPIDLTSDGDVVAVGGGSSVELWGVRDGLHRRSLEIEDGHVASVRFSPDGSLIALGGTSWLGSQSNGFVSLWTAEGEPLHELMAHPSTVESMTFSARGAWLATTSDDGVIRVWDVRLRGLMSGLEMNSGGAGTIVFLEDESALAAALPNGEISLWALPEARLLWRHTDFPVLGPLSDVAVAPDGRSIAAASEDGKIILWDVATGSRLLTLDQPVQVMQSAGVAFAPDGRFMVSVGDSIRQWQLPAGTLARQVVLTSPESPSHPAPEYVRWELASTQSDLAVLVVHDDQLDIRRGRDLQTTASLRCVTQAGFGPLALSPDGSLLASWLPRGVPPCKESEPGLSLWDAATGSVLVNMAAGLEGDWPRMAFSPDGLLLAVAGGSAIDLRLTSDLSLAKSLGPYPLESELTALAFAPDGGTLAAGAGDGRILIWDIATGEEIAWLEAHTQAVTGLAYAPDARYLASSSEDGTLRLWGVP